VQLERAQKIAAESLPWLRYAMQLASWEINVKWVRLDPGVMAQCKADVRYHSATLEVDPDAHDTKAELLDTLRHELAHVLHAEFGLYECAVAHLINQRERNVLDEIGDAAREKTVNAIERMLTEGIGLTPAQMIRRAKARARRGCA
jgi:hypothetical protein